MSMETNVSMIKQLIVKIRKEDMSKEKENYILVRLPKKRDKVRKIEGESHNKI